MAGQIPTRREVLEALGAVALAGLAPGFVRWAPAQQAGEQHHHELVPAPGAPAPRAPYQPVGFSQEQYRTIERLADLILPPDGELPGAAAAGVAEFIDFMVTQDLSLQEPFFKGLRALDLLSVKSAGVPFLSLSVPAAQALLTRLAYQKNFRPGDAEARDFFKLARKWTVTGFYTSELGYQALDSPNLKFYSESPGCPNPQDEEHRHA